MKSAALYIILGVTALCVQAKPAAARQSGKEPDKETMLQTYNPESGSGVERLLSGNTNADVEFLVEPELGGAYGLSLLYDAAKQNYRLELKKVANNRKVDSILEQRYPLREFPDSFPVYSPGMPKDLLSRQEKRLINKITKHNHICRQRRESEALLLYVVETHSHIVSDSLATMLRDKVARVYNNRNTVQKTSGILDGESVTFRYLDTGEQLTIKIHSPQKGDVQCLVNLFKTLALDIENGILNEAKYLK